MQVPFHLFLRELRQSRGLSQAYVATQAGIGRVTLSRWESGSQHPRFVELEAVFKVLQATPEQLQQAGRLLGRADEREQQVILEKSVGTQMGIGPRPHGGSLLCALRLRSGLSQEEAASRTGVTTRTLRRWEKAETWPSTSQLHTLCYVLRAHSRELMALTTGGVTLEMGSSGNEPDVEELERQLEALYYLTNGQQLETLKDLGFLALAVQAWPLAIHSDRGRHLLSHVYSYHANHCAAYERWSEGAIYAHRSLDLLFSSEQPHRGAIIAAIAAARCATYRGRQSNPAQGIEILQYWLEASSHPVFQSWMLSDMAKYGALGGSASQNLELAQRAREALMDTRFNYDLYLRELDEVQVLLQAGEVAQALAILERDRPDLHNEHVIQDEHIVRFRLLEAEAALKLDSRDRASECLSQAQELIDAQSLFHYQPRAQKLAQQF